MRRTEPLWIILGVLCLICIGGCEHVIELYNARVDPIANSPQGPAVKVTAVLDQRKFEPNPDNIQTPTVRDKKDLTKQAVTVMSLGKARNGIHTMFFVYPAGQSVETTVRGAVENALRTKGYNVIADGSPGVAGAIPVEVEIQNFWLWWDVGFWTIGANSYAAVTVKSPVVLSGATEPVQAHCVLNSPYMANGISEHCVGVMLDQLTKTLVTELRSPQ